MIKKSSAAFILFFVAFLPLAECSSVSHDISTMSWTLEDCLDYALGKSPRVRAAEEAVRSAKGQNLITASEFAPKVFWNSAYSYNSVAPLGGVFSGGTLRPSFYSQEVYNSALSVSQTFFSWKILPTFAAARANSKRSITNLRRAKNELVLDVRKAYSGAVFSHQSLAIARAAEAVAKENYETAENLYKEGKTSHFDISRARVRWVNSKTDLIASENALRITLESLKTVLDLPQNQELNVQDKFPEEMKEIKDAKDMNMDNLILKALRGRPEVEELECLETLGVSNVKAARAGFIPSLSANYTYSFESAQMETKSDKYYKSWIAGVALNIPLFDGLFSFGRLHSAKAELEQFRASKTLATDRIVLEVRQAYFSFKDACERVLAQKENVETAQENLRIAQERYAMGLLSQLELKDAELSLTESKTLYAKASFDYNMAQAALHHAVGEPFTAGKQAGLRAKMFEPVLLQEGLKE